MPVLTANHIPPSRPNAAGMTASSAETAAQRPERAGQLGTLAATIAPADDAQFASVKDGQQALGITSQELHFEGAVAGMDAPAEVVPIELGRGELVEGERNTAEHGRNPRRPAAGMGWTRAYCTDRPKRRARSVGGRGRFGKR